MRLVGRARISAWDGGGLWFIEANSDGLDVPSHAHHVIQATILLKGQMRLVGEGVQSTGPIMMVDADAEHHLSLDGAAALLFIDPESPAGRAVRARYFRSQAVAAIPEDDIGGLPSLVEAWRDQKAAMEPIGRELIRGLSALSPAPPTDPRIVRLIEAIGDRLDGPLSLADAASLIHLSPSRLRHLFVEQTGLPFKSYVLWRRMAKAAQMIGEGSSLTEAAHAAGFADSAHFSRTCRRMFGLPASALEYI